MTFDTHENLDENYTRFGYRIQTKEQNFDLALSFILSVFGTYDETLILVVDILHPTHSRLHVNVNLPIFHELPRSL